MDTGWGGDSKFGEDDKAVVQVTFKNAGEDQMISFRFQQLKNKQWKIDDIRYPNSDDLLLKELLRSAAEAK
jgi:ribosomal protein L22